MCHRCGRVQRKKEKMNDKSIARDGKTFLGIVGQSIRVVANKGVCLLCVTLNRDEMRK
jgi:hypothetical protein